jgi:predicted GNAT family acetyltransferase
VKVDNELISCVPAPHLYLGGKAPRFAILRGIWTDPRYRNRGFASQALGKICDELFDHLNLENIYLWVERDNAIAQQIYTKMGFICVSSWRGSRCYFK